MSSSPSSASGVLTHVTPKRNVSRSLLDTYYNIALNGSLITPKLQRHHDDSMNTSDNQPEQLESPTPSSMSSEDNLLTASLTGSNRYVDDSILQIPTIKKDLSFKRDREDYDLSQIPLVDDDFIQRHLNNLEILRLNLEDYEIKQNFILEQLKRLVDSPVLHLTESSSTFGSIESDIDIDLNYKLTKFIKSNSEDHDKVRKVAKVRNVVNEALYFINDEDLKNKKLDGLDHRLIDELTKLVELYTE